MTRDDYIHPLWSSECSLWEREPDRERLHRASLLLKTAPVQAVAELKSLSEKGSVLSMVYLGHAFQTGIGSPVDLRKNLKNGTAEPAIADRLSRQASWVIIITRPANTPGRNLL